jgi:DNA-binding beta-propeller fold protein YncE
MLGIMRYVNVIGKRVYVPDHVINTISVLDLNGKPLSTISGVRPTWNHDNQQVDSASDPLYYAMENTALINPYAICQGETPDIFLISEPFCSRILKVKIDKLTHPATPVTILSAVGGRRDESCKHDQPGHGSQFNCVTAVISLQRNRTGKACDDFDATAELPNYWRHNPLQRWYMRIGQTLTNQYAHWYGPWSRHVLKPEKTAEPIRHHVDAGNWEIKSYREAGKTFSEMPNQLNGYFLPGNLAMAVYHPHKPLLGQISPGSPILLVSNFNLGTVSLYQVGPLGNLLNYGVPFGMLGTDDGCLSGPQGMAVSCDGEVFVVDALNHRLSKWQILQTGQVAFIRNFVWDKNERTDNGTPRLFTPTDVAISADNRIFVTDQFNNRICVFNREGTPLHCQGKKGYWEEGEPDGDRFMLPTSVAIDGKHLIVNDLVNRALKIFDIDGEKLHFNSGISLFKRSVDEGGVWMPFFLYAQNRQVFVADSTYNIVQVFKY